MKKVEITVKRHAPVLTASECVRIGTDMSERIQGFTPTVRVVSADLYLQEEYEKKTVDRLNAANPDYMAAQFSRLAKHAGVSCVTYIKDTGTLLIETPLLFADIRTTSTRDSDRRRVCIGGYKVRIHSGVYGLSVEGVTQELYPARQEDREAYDEDEDEDDGEQYDHWAVRSGSPCWGEWQAIMEDCIQRYAIADMFDVVYHLLQAADQDESAYMRSNIWATIERKAGLENPATRGTLPLTGTPVIASDSYGSVVRGFIGRVVHSVDDGVIGVDWVPDIGEHDCRGEAHEGHGYNVPLRAIEPLTEENYARIAGQLGVWRGWSRNGAPSPRVAWKDVLPVDEGVVRVAQALEKLDALPDRTPLDVGRKIISHLHE